MRRFNSWTLFSLALLTAISVALASPKIVNALRLFRAKLKLMNPTSERGVFAASVVAEHRAKQLFSASLSETGKFIPRLSPIALAGRCKPSFAGVSVSSRSFTRICGAVTTVL